MTTEEFSNSFDTLLNSFSVQANFGEASSKAEVTLDEYEKSLFLTQAQEQIVIEIYSGRTDKSLSFEDSEEARSYLRNLISIDYDLTPVEGANGLVKNSYIYRLPKDIMFITFDQAELGSDAGCKEGERITSVPVTQDELHKILSNPFRGPSIGRVLRIDHPDGTIEVISKYSIKKYTISYLRKPKPIILSSLKEEGLSIDSYYDITECELDSVVHKSILDRAVLLAIRSKSLYSGK